MTEIITYDDLPESEKVKVDHKTLHGGYFDPELLMYPYVLRYPSKEYKRRVRVSINNYFGFPHFFASISVQENDLLRKDYSWQSISAMSLLDINSDLHSEYLRKDIQLNYDSGELNTVETAMDWITKTIKENGFDDESKYTIDFSNYTEYDKYDGYSFRDGD